MSILSKSSRVSRVVISVKHTHLRHVCQIYFSRSFLERKQNDEAEVLTRKTCSKESTEFYRCIILLNRHKSEAHL